MRFYRLDEIAVSRDDVVFKVSSMGKLIPLVVFAGLVGGFVWLGLGYGKPYRLTPPPWFAFAFAAFLGLFVWIAFQAWWASLRPSNWLVRCSSTGIVIHFRSYLNWRFPAGDIEAVGFDYGEIAWARTVKEKRITPDAAHHNAGQTTYLTYVDLGLAKADLSELEAQLRAERQRKPVGFMVSMDYPVQVLPGGVVEVRWSGGIKPAARKAIEFLGRHVKIVAADSRMVDLTHQWNLSPADERGKIIALAKSGDEIGAVKLAQQIYGVSLTDATEMVDKMVEES